MSTISTEQVTVDLDRINRELRETVRESGADFVYPSGAVCRYADVDATDEGDIVRTAPSCLWGHVFYRLDPGLLDYLYEKGVNEVDVRYLVEGGYLDEVIDFGERKAEFTELAQAMQWSQDRGASWGDLLAEWDQRMGFFQGPVTPEGSVL